LSVTWSLPRRAQVSFVVVVTGRNNET
jgi:hypothetical protein